MSFFNITGWGFRGTLNHHCALETVKFSTNDKKNLSLQQLIESVVPNGSYWHTLRSAFNGTLQTMALNYKAFDSPNKRVYYGRRIFQYKDGGSCSVDYVLPKPLDLEEWDKLVEKNMRPNFPRQNKGNRFLSEEEVEEKTKGDPNDESNVLVILHGLGGGSHEPLIRDLITHVEKNETGKLFEEIMVINTRGCSRTKITTPKLFCGFSTGDIREIVDEINEKFPKKKIFFASYSFGTVTLLNYLAEQSKNEIDNNIQLAFTVGGVWDLIDASYRLRESYSGRCIFEPALISFLNRLIKNNREELTPFADAHGLRVDNAFLKSFKEMSDFDQAYTAKMFNFNNASEYYRKVSPVNRIADIRVPTIAINSIDDPCIGIHLPYREVKSNPFVIQISSDLGGHLAFLDYKNESWVNKTMTEIYKTYIEKVDMNGKKDDLDYKPKINDFKA